MIPKGGLQRFDPKIRPVILLLGSATKFSRSDSAPGFGPKVLPAEVRLGSSAPGYIYFRTKSSDERFVAQLLNAVLDFYSVYRKVSVSKNLPAVEMVTQLSVHFLAILFRFIYKNHVELRRLPVAIIVFQGGIQYFFFEISPVKCPFFKISKK